MPHKLVRDPSPPRPENQPPERNLYLEPRTGNYYVKKFSPDIGRERVKCLKEKNRYLAIQKKNKVVGQWSGTKAPPESILFSTVAMELLKTYEEKALKTYLDMEGHLRLHILQETDVSGAPVASYANVTLQEALSHWETYKAEQRRLTPRRKLKHDRKHLRRIFGYAKTKKLIDVIPELPLDPFDRSVKKSEEFSNDEHSRMMANANPKLRLKIEIWLLTMMRAEEVRLIEWSWINWKQGTLTIPAWVTKMREEKVIALDTELLRNLRERREKMEPRYVFPHRDDPSQPESRSDKSWQRLKKKLGITKKRHWFRATGVRRAIREGESATATQTVAGMSDKVMKRHYFGVDLVDKRRVVEKIRKSIKLNPEVST